MRYLTKIVFIISSLALSVGVSASPLAFWATDGWTQFADDEGMVDGPGAGGQAFDTEYLYYKISGSELFLGLQTGFNVIDGYQPYGSSQWYYGGDMALSFDGVTIGDESSYEYGIDFGLYTKDYSSVNKAFADPTGRVNIGPGAATTGIDPAGMYSVSSWNSNVYSGHHVSDPFAIDDGLLHTGLLSNNSGSGGSSFFRTVSFNATGLDLSNVDAHWTMSCGNDNINGGFSVVPEPSLLSLLGLGLLGLGFVRRRKAKA